MGVIPNPKMAFIFPISCILALIFPILIKYFPKCVGKGSFPKSQIKSLIIFEPVHDISNNVVCATSKASDQPWHTHSLIRAFTSCLSNL